MNTATNSNRKFIAISQDEMIARIESLGVELDKNKFHNESWVKTWNRLNELLMVIEMSEPEDRKSMIQALKTINDNKQVALPARREIEKTWIALEVALEHGETND